MSYTGIQWDAFQPGADLPNSEQISLRIPKKVMRVIDAMAKLLGHDRTTMIRILINAGIPEVAKANAKMAGKSGPALTAVLEEFQEAQKPLLERANNTVAYQTLIKAFQDLWKVFVYRVGSRLMRF
jgi:metal-responsive CopG/Arc/MetJ family transcriptional regulator